MQRCSKIPQMDKLGLKRCKLVFEDRINQLPDELLATIISFLTVTEAGRTSVLSHRWEKLWNIPIFTGGSIMFDYKLSELLPEEHSKFVSRVNHVLASLNESSTLDDFSVRYYFEKDSQCHFDRWVEFALEKRIKRLELNMENFSVSPFLRYTFPNEQIYIMPSRVTSLTSLRLNSVNVSGEIIEYLIFNCQFLEEISLKHSDELTNLKVEGAAIKLKSLEVLYCPNVCSISISAPNLVSFHYSGTTNTEDLKIKNTPKLLEVYIGDGMNLYVPSSLSNYFPQLETFCMDIELVDYGRFYEPLRLHNLKHLILRAICHTDDGLLQWIELIESCPSLNRLTVEVLLISEPGWERRYSYFPSSHPCLKLVEIIGFSGCDTEVELVRHLLANCSALEKIVIDRHEPFPSRATFEESEKNIEAKKCALRLMEGYLPEGVDFVLI